MNDPDHPITAALRELADQAAPPRIRVDDAWRAGRRRRRAATIIAAAAVAVVLAAVVPAANAGRGGPPSQPTRPLAAKMSGLPLRVAPDLKLLVTTAKGAAWYSTATRRAVPIAGLPAVLEGYQFDRVDGGWKAWPIRYTSGCTPSVCVGKLQPYYFIADGSLTATRIGAGYFGGAGVRPASRAGAVWLVTFPSSTAKPTVPATAQLVGTAGQPLGPQYRLPAGYIVDRGVGSYLLLVKNANQNLFALWDPRTGRVVRRFANVLDAGPGQIAWTAGCLGCRVQVLNVATGKTVTTSIVPAGPAALFATFSDDGRLLAVQQLQQPGRDIEVFDTASRRLTVIPGTALSTAAWQAVGWRNGGHQLIVTAGPANQPGPAQVGYWQPGDTRLRIATIRNLGEISRLDTGSYSYLGYG